MKAPIEIAVSDLVQMRKPHPCGGDTWLIVRVGAEIGMRCQTCQHKVMLARADFERRLKRILPRATGESPDPSAAPEPGSPEAR